MSEPQDGRGADELKQAAAIRAAEAVEDGMILGLGTGSTVRFLLEHLAEERAAGRLRRVVGVPTSRDTQDRARRLGIPLATLDEHPVLDLAIDGADEVDPSLDLIKGLGGALLREKIVAAASRRLVIVVDESKLVPRLGTRAPLPVEVDPFGAAVQYAFLRALGAEPVLRTAAGGEPVVTDGGHRIVDCRFPDGIADPPALDRALHDRPGILETGLFLGMADTVVVAAADGVRVLQRPRGAGARA